MPPMPNFSDWERDPAAARAGVRAMALPLGGLLLVVLAMAVAQAGSNAPKSVSEADLSRLARGRASHPDPENAPAMRFRRGGSAGQCAQLLLAYHADAVLGLPQAHLRRVRYAYLADCDGTDPGRR